MHFLCDAFFARPCGASMSQKVDKTCPRRARIIGIGSPVADDDAGWRLAEALKTADLGRNLPKGSVDVVTCDHPGHLLLGILHGLRLAIIVDAMHTGIKLGSLRKLEMRDLDKTMARTSHSFGVANILALGHALGVLPPRVILYGIEAGPRSRMPSPSVWVKQCEKAMREDIRQALNDTSLDASSQSFHSVSST